MQETNSNLFVGLCSDEAAQYAVKHWHYSRSLPCGKLFNCGVWEHGKFIGCVIFARGSNRHIATPYSLGMDEVVELARVALAKHNAPVSKIVAMSIRLLKKHCPGLRLIVSYADLDQGHLGVIYQAGNWIFEGLVNQNCIYGFFIKGKKVHKRTVSSIVLSARLENVKKHLDSNAMICRTAGKYKYIYPLDKKMRKQLEKFRKPYPKRPVGQKGIMLDKPVG